MVNPGSDSVRLVRLSLRRGETIAEARLIEGVEVYFCAKDHCPHYQGQLGLLPDTATMHCALVHYPPDRTCEPFYLEAADPPDQAARPHPPPAPATMHCALVPSPPDRTCQPFYLEAAEHLDQAARHQTWEDRLDEAEALSSAGR